MLNARFVPIDRWPGPITRDRRKAPFGVSALRLLDDLEREMTHLRAKDVLIQAFFSYDQIRNDGWPRAGQTPRAPGVILSFSTANGPLSFPCDTYFGYEANLRAISLSLTALRAIDRYGVTKRAEQYAGWKQIAPPSDRPFSTKEEAATFICSQAYTDFAEEDIRDVINDAENRKNSYRRAASKVHPDTPGGNHELFVRLQAALALLEAR